MPCHDMWEGCRCGCKRKIEIRFSEEHLKHSKELHNSYLVWLRPDMVWCGVCVASQWTTVDACQCHEALKVHSGETEKAGEREWEWNLWFISVLSVELRAEMVPLVCVCVWANGISVACRRLPKISTRNKRRRTDVESEKKTKQQLGCSSKGKEIRKQILSRIYDLVHFIKWEITKAVDSIRVLHVER